MNNRTCIFCKSVILECMGGVIAGDLIMAINSKIRFSEIREVCGKCALVRHPKEIPEIKQN